MGKYKKYIFAYMAIGICCIITFGGVIASFSEGIEVGAGFVILGLMCFWFANNMLEDRFGCSMLKVLKELHLYTCVQFAFFVIPFCILVRYGTYFFDRFSQYKSLAGAANVISGVRDVEYFRRSNNSLANGALEHCIVLYGGAFLILVVLVMQIVKTKRMKRTVLEN